MLCQLDHNREQRHPIPPLPEICLKIISLGKGKQEDLTIGSLVNFQSIQKPSRVPQVSRQNPWQHEQSQMLWSTLEEATATAHTWLHG